MISSSTAPKDDLERRGWEVHDDDEDDLDGCGWEVAAEDMPHEEDLEVRGWEVPTFTSMPPAPRLDECAPNDGIAGGGVLALVAVGIVSGLEPAFSGIQAA